MDINFDVLKKYAVFKGRARRREFWTFLLVNALLSYLLAMFCGIAQSMFYTDRIDTSLVLALFYAAVLLPSLAAGVRRMHDVGKSGWYLLVPLYNLYLACIAGDAGENQYGPDLTSST